MSKCTVILLAGGIGSRMKSEMPKQFLPVGPKPIARHSYDLFVQHPLVDEIVVVCSEEYRHHFDPTVTFALPGARRQDSVFNGFSAIKSSPELVCIHDAARPFIDSEMISRAITAAEEHGATTVGMPVKHTLKQHDGQQQVTGTPDRSLFWEIQTPQVIKRELLAKGFEKAQREELTVTDDVSLVEQLDQPVKLVEGSYQNIKITTPNDLLLAELIYEKL